MLASTGPSSARGLRSENLPRSFPPLSSDSPVAMSPPTEAAQWRTLGNQAQLGLGGKDTGWHNSPFSPSPCQQGSLPLSPLVFPPHLAGFSRQAQRRVRLADSAGILARDPRCSLDISGAGRGQRIAVRCRRYIYPSPTLTSQCI